MDIANFRIFTEGKFWNIQNLQNGKLIKRFKFSGIGRENAINHVRFLLGIK